MTRFCDLPPEVQEELRAARERASDLGAQIIALFVDKLELDLVNACLVAVGALCDVSEDPELPPFVVEKLRILARSVENKHLLRTSVPLPGQRLN